MIDEAAVGADEHLERTERRQLLNGLVDDLPEEKREVLRMVYNAELDIRDIAEQLGIPEGTVKSRMFHARRQLADRWSTGLRRVSNQVSRSTRSWAPSSICLYHRLRTIPSCLRSTRKNSSQR